MHTLDRFRWTMFLLTLLFVTGGIGAPTVRRNRAPSPDGNRPNVSALAIDDGHRSVFERRKQSTVEFPAFVMKQLVHARELIEQETDGHIGMPFGIYDDQLLAAAASSGYVASFTLGAPLDYISPMLYPSGFTWGLPGCSKPAEDPGQIVRRSLAEAQQRTGLPGVRFRPWLQAFRDYAFDRREFGAAEIRAQIDAAGIPLH